MLKALLFFSYQMAESYKEMFLILFPLHKITQHIITTRKLTVEIKRLFLSLGVISSTSDISIHTQFPILDNSE